MSQDIPHVFRPTTANAIKCANCGQGPEAAIHGVENREGQGAGIAPRPNEYWRSDDPIDASGFPWRTPDEGDLAEDTAAYEKQMADAMNKALYGSHRADPRVNSYLLMGRVSPLMMHMALAYWMSPETPQQFFRPETWASSPADAARVWLVDNGLVEKGEPTAKLEAWLMEVLATPLPVQRWEVPGR